MFKIIKKTAVIIFVLKVLIMFAKPSFAPPHPRFYSQEGKRNFNDYIERDMPSKRSYKVLGERGIAVLLIDFQDKPHKITKSKKYFEELILEDKKGSMQNYYKEASYGQFSIIGEISEWVTSSQNMSYYGLNDNDETIKKLIEEAITKSDEFIDFSKYDTDNDGYLDHLIVVHSGDAEEWTADESDIWSHRWIIDEMEVDGIKIASYTLQAETSPMGIFAHEFGHELGLSDLYNTKTGYSKIGAFSLMDHGSWNGGGASCNGEMPAHMTAWEKMQLGWIEPEILYDDGKYDIAAFSQYKGGTAFIVDLDYSGQEYLMIENRIRKGYDSELPGEGILIYHIYEKNIGEETLESDINGNSLNNRNPLRVKILEANGTNDIGLNKKFGDAGDFFYDGNVNKLDWRAEKTPNTCIWDITKSAYKNETGRVIDNVSSVSEFMSFEYKNSLITDINSDGVFDIKDIKDLKKMYNSKFGEENYNSAYDYNKDKLIDVKDLKEFKKKAANNREGLLIWEEVR